MKNKSKLKCSDPELGTITNLTNGLVIRTTVLRKNVGWTISSFFNRFLYLQNNKIGDTTERRAVVVGGVIFVVQLQYYSILSDHFSDRESRILRGRCLRMRRAKHLVAQHNRFLPKNSCTHLLYYGFLRPNFPNALPKFDLGPRASSQFYYRNMNSLQLQIICRIIWVLSQLGLCPYVKECSGLD